MTFQWFISNCVILSSSHYILNQSNVRSNITENMRPYRRRKLVRVQFYNPDKTNFYAKTAKKSVNLLLTDIQSIWSRDPPFPASMRIIMSLGIIWVFMLPFLYLLVPPLFTGFAILVLTSDNWTSLLDAPVLEEEQKRNFCYAILLLFKKTMYRLSVVVTIYDYVQTFRAIGIFNF